MSTDDALSREVDQRMKLELGALVQKVIQLQAQNAFLMREVERLSALVPTGE